MPPGYHRLPTEVRALIVRDLSALQRFALEDAATYPLTGQALRDSVDFDFVARIIHPPPIRVIEQEARYETSTTLCGSIRTHIYLLDFFLNLSPYELALFITFEDVVRSGDGPPARSAEVYGYLATHGTGYVKLCYERGALREVEIYYPATAAGDLVTVAFSQVAGIATAQVGLTHRDRVSVGVASASTRRSTLHNCRWFTTVQVDLPPVLPPWYPAAAEACLGWACAWTEVCKALPPEWKRDLCTWVHAPCFRAALRLR